MFYRHSHFFSDTIGFGPRDMEEHSSKLQTIDSGSIPDYQSENQVSAILEILSPYVATDFS